MAKSKNVTTVLASFMGGQEQVRVAAAQIAAALATSESVPQLLEAKAEELREMAALIRACCAPNANDGCPAGDDGCPSGEDGCPSGEDGCPSGEDGCPSGEDSMTPEQKKNLKTSASMAAKLGYKLVKK